MKNQLVEELQFCYLPTTLKMSLKDARLRLLQNNINNYSSYKYVLSVPMVPRERSSVVHVHRGNDITVYTLYSIPIEDIYIVSCFCFLHPENRNSAVAVIALIM